MSSSASRVWTTSGRPVCARRLDMRPEPLALRGPVGLVVIIVEPAFADRDHARMRRRLDQRRRAEVGMRIRFVGMNADARPDIGMALGRADDVVPLLLAGRNIEKTATPARPGSRQHFLLPLGEALVIEVAMAIDQGHAAASSSPSSSRGKIGVGWAIGAAILAAVDQRDQLFGRRRNDRRDRFGQLPDRDDKRSQHGGHPVRVGLLERPGRGRIDIGVAGEHRAHPCFEADREGEAVEFLGEFVAGLRDLVEQGAILRLLRPAPEESRPNS